LPRGGEGRVWGQGDFSFARRRGCTKGLVAIFRAAFPLDAEGKITHASAKGLRGWGDEPFEEDINMLID